MDVLQGTTALLLLSALTLPALAGDTPTVGADVQIVGPMKSYVYTLTNDLDWTDEIYQFMVMMPQEGAERVIDFACSKSGWGVDSSFRGDYSMWAMYAFYGAQLMPGETVTFTLTTPAAVPTSWNYKPPDYPSNWRWSAWESGFGSYNLPVPVPEPSTFFALALGLAALIARRRR